MMKKNNDLEEIKRAIAEAGLSHEKWYQNAILRYLNGGLEMALELIRKEAKCTCKK